MLEKEIHLLNKEEVIIPITTCKSDKMVLNKRNTAIIEEKISALFIKKKIDNVEKLIKQTSRDLEDIKEFIGRPYKKSPKDMDIIIIDIRKKLNKAQESIKNCDPKSIENISEIDILIDRHVALEPVAGYHELVIDSKKAKKDFIDNCSCREKGRR